MVSKIGKLLAKAESTSSQPEAEALFGKAQQLASQHSIELAVSRRMHTDTAAPETPEERTLNIGPARSVGLKEKVSLWAAVAHANDLRWSARQNSTTVWPIGFPSDLDAAEALYGVLAEQMVRFGNDWLASREWVSDTYITVEREYRYHRGMKYLHESRRVEKPMNLRVARRRFYEGFVAAVEVRLDEARSAAVAAAEEAESAHPTPGVETPASGGLSVTTLALQDKTAQLDEFQQVAFRRRGVKGAYRGSRATASGGYDSLDAGAVAGRAAAMSHKRQLGS